MKALCSTSTYYFLLATCQLHFASFAVNKVIAPKTPLSLS